jgi:nitrogen fixation protein
MSDHKPTLREEAMGNTESIPRYVPKKYKNRIMFWDDERNIGNALIITLKDGWRFTHGDVQHVCGVDTVQEGLAALRGTEACDCEGCCKSKGAK